MQTTTSNAKPSAEQIDVPVKHHVKQFDLLKRAINNIEHGGTLLGEVFIQAQFYCDQQPDEVKLNKEQIAKTMKMVSTTYLTDAEKITRECFDQLKLAEMGAFKHRSGLGRTQSGRERKCSRPFVALSIAIKDLIDSKPFSCLAKLKLTERFASKDEGTKYILQARKDGGGNDWKSCGRLMSVDIDALTDMSRPSHFGDLRTNETVYDEQVRLAREIEADNLRLCELSTKGSSHKEISWQELPRFHELCATIESALHLNCYCELKFQKLNIYGEGGFFRPHVDTPIVPNMIGTAVINLPTVYTGGQFIVRHAGTSHTWNFGGDIISDKPQLPCVAFYGDCQHEVMRVESGHRVTLTFAILPVNKRKYATPSKKYIAGGVTQTEQASTVDRIIKSASEYGKSARAQKKPLAVVLSHKYTNSETTDLSPHGLKGVDKTIYDSLSKVFRCTLKHVVVRHCLTRSTNENIGSEQTARVFSFEKEDLKMLATIPQPRSRDRHQCGTKEDAFSSQRPLYTFIDTVRGKMLDHQYESESEWTGNEASPESIDTIYFSVALLTHELLQ